VGHTIAIDLGSCNSSVAVLDRDEPRILLSNEGGRATPSFVGFVAGERVLVGAAAKRQAVMNPELTVHSLKHLLGRRFDVPDVQRLRARLGFAVVRSPEGLTQVRLAGKDVDPDEIVALLLHRMKRIAEVYLEAAIDGAYVTIPSAYNRIQRERLQAAALRAGLPFRGFFAEAVAAAVWAGAHRRRAEYVAVVDIGGTCEATILAGGGALHARGARCDPTLGGDAFDARIVARLVELLREQGASEIGEDVVALQRLRDAAEVAKVALSREEAVQLSLAALVPGPAGPVGLEYRLTRAELAAITHDLMARVEAPCRAALDQAGIKPAAVGELVVCGGLANLPMVRSRVEQVFEQPAVALAAPEEAVVLGAVVLAHPALHGGDGS
jgi:molecular chaperone DnaK